MIDMDKAPAPIQEEKRVRIEDIEKMCERIKKEGGVFVEEKSVQDTYFMQPAGEVLKLSIEDGKAYLVRMQFTGQGYDMVKRKEIDDGQRCRADLASHYGISMEAKMHTRTYEYGETMLFVTSIDGIGDFLIARGKNVDEMVFKELGIEKPEFLEANFDQL